MRSITYSHMILMIFLLGHLILSSKLIANIHPANQFIEEKKTLLIACASNFYDPLREIVLLYQTHHPQTEIIISAGASSALATQIYYHPDKYDLFVSADSILPIHLLNANIGYQSEVYAIGSLVLYNFGKSIKSFQDWQSKSNTQTLAIANPKLAPYGQAAQSVLTYYQITPKKIVMGNQVTQAYQFALSGHANAAIIAKSLVKNENSTAIINIPEESYAPIEQRYLLIKHSNEIESFSAFMHSDEARAIIQAYGYR